MTEKEEVGIHGQPKGQLLLVDHQSIWARIYQNEVSRIQASIEVQDLLFFHIGSTAVPALLAKPIIDIAVVFRDANQLWMLADGLKKIGYTFRGTHEEPNHWYFVLDRDKLRLFHVHAWLEGSAGLDRHLEFVQQLINFPALRDRYAQLKLEWAEKANWNKQLYSSQKDAFVQEVLDWTA
ncbi:MAG: GrpB family protein [Bacteroidota bacterium]